MTYCHPLHLIPGIKSSDYGSHWLGCPCCCQTSHSTSNNQDLWKADIPYDSLYLTRSAWGWREIKPFMLICTVYVDGYLGWGYFSCSCDLTSEEPAKVVGSQNHGFVPAKQAKSCLLWPGTPEQLQAHDYGLLSSLLYPAMLAMELSAS